MSICVGVCQLLAALNVTALLITQSRTFQGLIHKDKDKDRTHKDQDKDKDLTLKDQDQDKDQTYKDKDKDKDLKLVLKDKDKDKD